MNEINRDIAAQEHSVLGGVQQQQGPGPLHHPVRCQGQTLVMDAVSASAGAAEAGQDAAQHDPGGEQSAPEADPDVCQHGEEGAVAM